MRISLPSEVAEGLNCLTTEQLQQLNRLAWTCGTFEEFINQLPIGN